MRGIIAPRPELLDELLLDEEELLDDELLEDELEDELELLDELLEDDELLDPDPPQAVSAAAKSSIGTIFMP